MSLYTDLLDDAGALRQLLVRIDYWDGAAEQTQWVSQMGYMTTAADTPAHTWAPGDLLNNIRFSANFDPESGGSPARTGVIELSNLCTNNETNGPYDLWPSYSVDGRTILAYWIGTMSDGTEVGLADVINEPYFRGVGIGTPVRGDAVCRIVAKDDSRSLDREIDTATYSPPCLLFPGTSAGKVDFGDVQDQTGSFTLEGWVWVDNPATVGQRQWEKDTGTAGWGLTIGDAGSGTVRFYIRELSVVSLDTAVDIIQARRWHHLAGVYDHSTHVKKIYVDGVLLATSAVLTGTPANNSASLTCGTNLSGKWSKGSIFTGSARTIDEIQDNMRLQYFGNEASLSMYIPAEEGEGSTVADYKSGSTTVGTLGTGVDWDTAEWAHQSISGKARPRVFGIAHVPFLPVDPAQQILQCNYGQVVSIATPRSNQFPLAGGNYSLDLNRGLLVVISAGLNGMYSADVCASNIFKQCLLFNGTSDNASASITAPAGSMTVEVLVRATKEILTANGHIVNWRNGTSAGLRLLRQEATGGLTGFSFAVRNDAGTQFIANDPTLRTGKWLWLAGVIDTAQSKILLYIDGDLVAQTATTGTFNTVLSTCVLGKLTDGASSYFPGEVDEFRLWNVARTQAQIRSLLNQEVIGTETNLQDAYHFNTVNSNAVSGRPSITITGAPYSPSRCTPADITQVIYQEAGFSLSDLSAEDFRLANVAFPYDVGVLMNGDGDTYRDAITKLLRGLRYHHGPDDAGLIRLERFTGLGTSEHTYTSHKDFQAREIEPAESMEVIYRVVLAFAENYAKISQESVAAALAGTGAGADPERYLYGAQSYKTVKRSDLNIRSGGYPNAHSLGTFERPLVTSVWRQQDASVLASEWLSLLSQPWDAIRLPLFSRPASRRLLDTITISMDDDYHTALSSDWIVTSFEAEDDEWDLVIQRPRDEWA